MAIKVANGGKFVIASADAFYIGNTSNEIIGTFMVMCVSASFVGSITVKARAQNVQAGTDNVTPVPVNYLGRYVNGAIGTDALGSAALTNTSLILVPASGQTIVLDCTSFTSGTMTVYCVPLLGAAA